jgi:hypothetical protein
MKPISLRGDALRAAVLGIALAATAPVAPAQQVGAKAPEPATAAKAARYTAYRGVKLGATTEETRTALGKPSSSDETSDVFLLSEEENATVYYDKDHHVVAVVTTYFGPNAKAPDPKMIVGKEVKPGEGGVMSEVVRYTEDGFSVTYYRTAGDEPTTIVTMRKL